VEICQECAPMRICKEVVSMLEHLKPEQSNPHSWHCPSCHTDNANRHERCWKCGKLRLSNDSTLRSKSSAEQEDDCEEAWTPWGL
jgi:hypothetical protein